jgi:hypothetical protein
MCHERRRMHILQIPSETHKKTTSTLSVLLKSWSGSVILLNRLSKSTHVLRADIDDNVRKARYTLSSEVD